MAYANSTPSILNTKKTNALPLSTFGGGSAQYKTPMQTSRTSAVTQTPTTTPRPNVTPSSPSATSTQPKLSPAGNNYASMLMKNDIGAQNPTSYAIDEAGRMAREARMASATPTIQTVSTASATKTESPQNAYIKYLTGMFNPEKLAQTEKNINQLNERTTREIERARKNEEALRANKQGQLATAQGYDLAENERTSNKSLADIAIAKGAAVDTYNTMLGAGKTVYEAELAAEKAQKDALPDEARLYEYAKGQGYTGSFTDFIAKEKSPTDQYGTGSIGEYNFYAEQEKLAGRQPMSFSEYQTADANRKAAASGGGLTPYQQFQATQSISKDNAARTESAREILRQTQLMKTAYDSFARGGDKNIATQAIISTFNKILDPTSVVREGEYDRTAQGQSLLSTIQGRLQNITQGGSAITPATLKAAVDLAEQFLEGSRRSLEAENERSARLAEQFGLDSSFVTSGQYGQTTPQTQYQVPQLKPMSYPNLDSIVNANPNVTAIVDQMILDGLSEQDIFKRLQGFNSGSSGTPTATGMRTDRHNNPTAFTTDVARNAGLIEGVDYVAGDPFPNNPNLKTARLIGDPIDKTIRVIDRIGFYTQAGNPRWTYINKIPEARNWNNLSYNQKKQVIAKMYQNEGGTQLKSLLA